MRTSVCMYAAVERGWFFAVIAQLIEIDSAMAGHLITSPYTPSVSYILDCHWICITVTATVTALKTLSLFLVQRVHNIN